MLTLEYADSGLFFCIGVENQTLTRRKQCIGIGRTSRRYDISIQPDVH